MEYRYIGRSGLRVSPICMGTMTFGTQTPDEKAVPLFTKKYLKISCDAVHEEILYPMG